MRDLQSASWLGVLGWKEFCSEGARWEERGKGEGGVCFFCSFSVKILVFADGKKRVRTR
jgi:hypothetical protein